MKLGTMAMKGLGLSLMFVSSSAMFAQAGTTLKFNSGTVNTTQLSQNASMVEAKDSAATDYIVQFKSAITEADKKALRAQFTVFGYLPEDALVVRATFAKLKEFQKSHASVQAVVKYLNTYKVSQSFAAASVFNQYNFDSVLITTFQEADSDVVANKIIALNPHAKLEVVDGRSVIAVVPRGMVDTIAAFTGVEHIQPTPIVESMDFTMDKDLVETASLFGAGDYTDLKGDEPGTRVMKFDAAWAAGYTGRGQFVSMADTGLDSGNMQTIHPDFAGGVASGYPFGLWGKSWEDPMGHGTHVAGSVMGRGTASKGLLKGGANEAKMVAESLWSPMLNNLSIPTKIGDLFAKAQTDGARVHTNSWGSARSPGVYDNMAMQVDEWLFNNPDMLVLFAAGNSGTDKNKDGRIDANSVGSPGTAKNVMTVGASENVVNTGGIQVPINKLRAAVDEWPVDPINSDYISNNADGLAMFSSRGPTTDGRIKPDIVAPGTNILSVRSQIKGANELWGAYNQDYVWSGGTSMSTPLTAGAAVVTRQVLVEKLGMNPSGAMLKATMLHTAVDMYPGQFGEVGEAKGQELLTRRPNSDEGYGRVDMSNVAALDNKATNFVDNRTGVGQGGEASYSFTLAAPGRLYANLVWTDAPGSANAATALVNDLDLVLTTPSGSTVSMNDHTNNLEMLELSSLPAGTYKLSVRGYKVPQGKNGAQPYALVYTVK